jgi:transposase
MLATIEQNLEACYYPIHLILSLWYTVCMTTNISPTDQRFLLTFITKGIHKAREMIRAEILLQLYDKKEIPTIAHSVRRSTKTILRIQQRYHDGGLTRALYDLPRSGQPKKTTEKDDAYLVALACTKAPHGSVYWTLDLLTEAFVKKRKKTIGRSVISLRLQARHIKPWREKNVVYTDTHS